MPKLTYWCAPILSDHPCYNIRTKTKKAALAEIEEYSHQDYGKPQKVVIDYDNAFDLLQQVTGEGGVLREPLQ